MSCAHSGPLSLRHASKEKYDWNNRARVVDSGTIENQGFGFIDLF